ncbi:MAG: Tetratricopeptide repeat protein [bacterium ADurb.Bin270]|nr:MAG: Tetratricopeptide repeat protein [bacterium ADurb.Bin270]
MKKKTFIFQIIIIVALAAASIPANLPAQMLGEAPVASPSASPPPRGPGEAGKPVSEGQPQSIADTIAIPKPPEGGRDESAAKPASTEINPLTQKDYSWYLKSGDKSPKWNEFIEPAFQSFDSGNFATAGIFLQRAYDAGCRDPLILFRLALIKESREGYIEAANMYLEAAKGVEKRYPGHPISRGIHKHVGRSLYKVDRPAEALPFITEALRHSPNDFMMLLMAGQILRSIGENDKARIALEKALTVERPAGSDGLDSIRPVLHELILATFALQNVGMCSKYVEQMTSLDPSDQVASIYRRKIAEIENKRRERELIKRLTE